MKRLSLHEMNSLAKVAGIDAILPDVALPAINVPDQLDRPKGVSADVMARESVQKYVEGLKKKKRDRQFTSDLGVPLLGASAIAGGLGLRALGERALTPEGERRVNEMINIGNRLGPQKASQPWSKVVTLQADREALPHVKGSGDFLMDYIDRASAVSKVNLFARPGVDANDLGTGGISTPKLIKGIEDRVGVTNNIVNNPRDEEDMEHMPTAEAGPLPFYNHLMIRHTLEPDDKSKPFFFKDSPWESKMDQIDMKQVRSALQTHLLDYTNLVAKGFGKSPVTGDPVNTKYGDTLLRFKDAPLDPVKNPNGLNHGQQMDVVRGFNGYLRSIGESNLADIKQHMDTRMAEEETFAGASYSRLAKTLKTVGQDIPKAVGTGLAVAGGAGLAYWLWRKMKQNRERQDSKRLDKRVEQEA